MSDLDTKIAEAVLGTSFNPDMPTPNFVNKIKQAFADAGYIQMPTTERDKAGFIRINPEILKASTLTTNGYSR